MIGVLIAGAPSAEATKWVYIGQGYSVEMNKQSVYIDDSSVSGENDKQKEAWVQTVDTPPDCSSGYAQDMKKCIASGIYYRQYFSDKTFCTIRAINYFTDGTSDGERILADGSKLKQVLCRKSNGTICLNRVCFRTIKAA